MSDLAASAAVLAILLVSSAFGVFIQRFLSDAHRSRETKELSLTVTNMLVTLTALILGLLTNSVVQSFNQAGSEIRLYSVELIALGQTLQEIGPEAEPARGLLRIYVASAIASTWPDEPKPANATILTDATDGDRRHPRLESVALGAVLDRVGREVRRLPAGDAVRTELVAAANRHFDALMQDRWKLVERTGGTIPSPFMKVLIFWLAIVFLSLGLISPRNTLALTTIVLGGVAIAAVIFAIMEMSGPFTGIITVSSEPMRDALVHLGG
nr:hypothetical protein [uncultured Rhodopila sp.]